jgi:DNA-binding NarL/FixJ family response regulator
MKILIVDDHELVRQGLVSWFVQQDANVCVVEAHDVDSAINAAQGQADIDLVLFDLGLPGLSGMPALRAFRQAHDSLPVVVLSGLTDEQTVLDALGCGAMGFIPKTSSMQELQIALRLVLSGRIYLPSMFAPVTQHTVTTPAALHEKLAHLQLTERQKQVFKLVLQGKPNKMIARDLGVAETTIKSHIRPILQALNVTSRVEAIVEVSRLGLSFD